MTRTSRLWFALTAVVVTVGIVVQLFVTSDPKPGAFFPDTWKRVLNVFCFFTILSNLAVGVSSALLATGRTRPSTWFRTLRLIGVVGIALTFVVFHAVLRQLQDLTGDAAFADLLLHTVSPVLCVVGWLWFGPRRQITPVVVWLAVGFPVVWGTLTLIRGHAIGFYPYPFIDPRDSGYARVAVNLVVIAAVFVGMAAGAMVLDRRLRDRTV